jgi:hypothetical protein
MKTRHRRSEPEHRARDLNQLAAIIRFRAWDADLTAKHGPLYYRAMEYTVH